MHPVIQKCVNNGYLSLYDRNENHNLEIVSVIGFTDFTRVFVTPGSIILTMRFLIETKKLFVSPNNSVHKIVLVARVAIRSIFSAVPYEHHSRTVPFCNGKT